MTYQSWGMSHRDKTEALKVARTLRNIGAKARVVKRQEKYPNYGPKANQTELRYQVMVQFPKG